MVVKETMRTWSKSTGKSRTKIDRERIKGVVTIRMAGVQTKTTDSRIMKMGLSMRVTQTAMEVSRSFKITSKRTRRR